MSSGFITETEIESAKRKRQEEWEKVRKADDPLEAPEPVYDSRSLYERLQEQKQKKDLEYEEAHKLKNMIKGLDDDEIEFLDLVDKTKMAVDRRKMIEEENELKDYRNRVASLNGQSIEKKMSSESSGPKIKPPISNRISQTDLLKKAVVAKSAVKHKLNESDSKDDLTEESQNKKTKVEPSGQEESASNNPKSPQSLRKNKNKHSSINNCLISDGKNSVMKCIGILPGMGYYTASSSEDSSDSDHDFNLSDIVSKPTEKKEENKQHQ